MTLAQLIQECEVRKSSGPLDVEVTGLCADSRRVARGQVFFALRGAASDGHEHVAAAIAGGAVAVVAERQIEVDPGISMVLVPNSRRAMAKAAQVFSGDPTRDLPVIGVTGTNGKTTVTYLLEAMLQQAGLDPAVIGTINYRFGERQYPALHTTPESIGLMSRIDDFRAAGAASLVMEVSSHALDQFRADGVRFRAGVFTNLTPEHLDYHPDMEHYFKSKCRLFEELLAAENGRAVINVDDPYGQRLATRLPGALTCGRSRTADVHFTDLNVSLEGIQGTVSTPAGDIAICSELLGDYNVENLLCAIGGAVALDLPTAAVARAVSRVRGVPGRLERIENRRDAVILVDYAHTGDALRRVLEALRELEPNRIITVFGCGGDRDRSKRPVMAETAARLSDLAIATSDNPRTEDPERILADVRTGLTRVHAREWSLQEMRNATKPGYTVIPDRRAAIRFAVSLLRPGDLLLVAGKGHEDYQILGSRRIHFDDREELRSALESGGSV